LHSGSNSADSHPWEQRGLALYTILGRLQKQKTITIHTWLYTILLAISTSVLCDPLHAQLL
jgi:hypothetical protein